MYTKEEKVHKFKLTEQFIEKMKEIKPPFGPLGELVFYRTYSRIKEDGAKEQFWETVKRVVEGCYQYQLNHCKQLRLPWNPHKSQKSAQNMALKIMNLKFSPPGRGFWMCGGKFVEETGSGSLYNCCFISTENILYEGTMPFKFIFDCLFLGSGVGYDTRGKDKLTIKKPVGSFVFEIPDCREGWTESLHYLLEAYFFGNELPIFDYSKIRPAGLPLKRFGGTSSGYKGLEELHKDVIKLLDTRIDKTLSSTNIVDIANMIGRCVVSGNIRRSAEIALGDIDDKDFMEMKDYKKYPYETRSWRWMSNNSVFAEVGKTDYSKLLNTKGEIYGLFWLKNAQKYSRMVDAPDWKDSMARGINPCSEQILESGEGCNITETYPANHDTFEEFKETLKYCYLYNKSITLIPTGIEKMNQVQLKNRRMGISMTGIIQAFEKHGKRTMFEWCDKGYKYLQDLDKIYSDWLCIPKSIKLTTVKPSGTVSLLAGATPGIHFPHSKYYIRRIRFNVSDKLLDALDEAGYLIENEVSGGAATVNTTKVVSFPIEEKYFEKSKDDVSIWEQVSNVVALQRWWSDNSVSSTITFTKEEREAIPRVLETYEDQLKTISFLPLTDHGFALAPYEKITEEQYKEMAKILRPIDFSKIINDDGSGSKFCDSESCELVL